MLGAAGRLVGYGETREQHHHLRGNRYAGRAECHQHEDAGKPGRAHEVGGFVDERFRDRGEDQHRSRNDTGASPVRVHAPSVTVTAPMRVWIAQTIALCNRLGIAHTAIGRHRGERLGAKAVGLASRSLALVRWARADSGAAGGRGFDLALGHGSNDVTVAAAILRVPSATMFDYEWATVQHNVNCRLARAVVVPDAIPLRRLERYGAKGKVRSYE